MFFQKELEHGRIAPRRGNAGQRLKGLVRHVIASKAALAN